MIVIVCSTTDGTEFLNMVLHLAQWRKSDGKFGGGDDDTACGPKFESLIHVICHDKTSDTVEDNLY